jgi:hypothetical protein
LNDQVSPVVPAPEVRAGAGKCACTRLPQMEFGEIAHPAEEPAAGGVGSRTKSGC